MYQESFLNSSWTLFKNIALWKYFFTVIISERLSSILTNSKLSHEIYHILSVVVITWKFEMIYFVFGHYSAIFNVIAIVGFSGTWQTLKKTTVASMVSLSVLGPYLELIRSHLAAFHISEKSNLTYIIYYSTTNILLPYVIRPQNYAY